MCKAYCGFSLMPNNQDAADALGKFKMLNKTIGIISNFDVRIHDLVTAMGLRCVLQDVNRKDDL